MNKFIKYFICLLIVFGIFVGVAYATDLKLNLEYVTSYDESGIYDVDVVVNDNFDLASENLVISISEELKDDFGIFEACQKLDGTLVDGCTPGGEDEDDEFGKRIGYKHPEELDATLKDIPGEIVLTFNDAATLKDGTKVDIVMTIDNIKIRKWKDVGNDRPVVILRQGHVFISNEANSSQAGFSVNYDIAFELRRNGTVVKNLTWGIIFSDIDVYHKDRPDYSESIELLSGIKDNKVYRLIGSENYLCINEKNTKFTTAKVCENPKTDKTWNLIEEEEMFKGGFAVIIDSSGFKYNWTGSGCGTDISFLTNNPPTGNVSKVIIVIVLFVVSSIVMFIFSRKFNKSS